MDEAFLISAFILGACIGAVYFGGLWLTIALLPQGRARVPVLIASYLARIAVTLAGFYFILVIDLWQFLACFAGFIVARQAIMYCRDDRSDTGDGDGDNP